MANDPSDGDLILIKTQNKIKKLSAIREAFCQRYTTHWNATRAAKESGYKAKWARNIGNQLLHNTLVKRRIEELTAPALREMGISRERVLLEMSRIAFVDISKAYDRLGQLLPIKEMPEDVRRTISKIKTFENFHGSGDDKELIGFTKEVEFAQKKGALDSLAKHLGLTPDKVEHSGPDGKPIETKNSQEYSDDQLDARIRSLLPKDPE